ncbi:glycosyltransferase family 2 protein [Mesorhizobium mediterraneum]|uniref:Glycosyl transferase family 2 n=2 Tax=Mesorhizobium TaxID=68287 RepID=A0AB36R702_9HYPH|nr:MULTISPECIES: glycosyltransferase family 2 protein [Mesorhizobium]AZO63870.1 hypothetical protein EJ075_02145 [Mesorhizobium sp. M6A.T.Cr.TU.016.01.1.1]PAQ00525.1 hypothetical protein CIT25_19250 [Mesorhizobium mediterraneum]RWN38533.1 MAG: hypothetical protein EOR96_22690 [Mesorhizobium sp.]RWO98366.1 MAG: hypothetical protein EOQ98_16615 [Mesorhizobium sp.]RWP54893.1 MAG: hypothetical protein EOR06_08440 [Mesorhizobium sp.]
MIVRDEADVIEKNLRFHESQGFDYFGIIDNLSTDGTRDIIEDLSKDIPMTILSEENTDYRQDVWAGRLAECLSQRGIDLAISLDADEFISGLGSTFKEIADELQCPLMCPRHNMVPLKAEFSEFAKNPLLAARYRVARPLSTQLPIMLRSMPGKMLFPLQGLRSIARGNHSIEHEIGERSVSDRALIRHFPVRTYDHFLKKLEQARARFRQEQDAHQNTSWHIRRWLSLKDDGFIENEYASFFVGENDMKMYLSDGTIVEDLFSNML